MAKKTKKTRKKTSAEGDGKVEDSCATCHFMVPARKDFNIFCKRHREFMTALRKKKILAPNVDICDYHLPKLR